MDLLTPITHLSEQIGDLNTALVFGLITGLIFGFGAQRSALCLRSASVALARGRLDKAVPRWMLAFATALIAVQLAELVGLFRSDTARIMSAAGTWSGAIVGGLIFGIGMVMARGCSGRLLVLAGTGNLRSMVAGMVFALTAQATLFGVLAPLRQAISSQWMTAGGRNVNLLTQAGLPQSAGVLIGLAFVVLAFFLAFRVGTRPQGVIFSCLAGLSIAIGWVATYSLSQVSFEPIYVASATFAAPSAETAMAVLQAGAAADFGLGLIPGVFLGAFLGALVGKELRWQSYDNPGQMLRSLIGGAFMGFGGVVAGGCAIGAGLTGTSIFTGTLWVATLFFFVGAWIADWIFDRREAQSHAKVHVQR